MGKYVKHIKIAKNLLKGSLAAIVSFLKTTKNLIFKSLKTLKIWKIEPYTLKIWKKVLNIFINSLKPAKKAVWPSWLLCLKDRKFNFDIYN